MINSISKFLNSWNALFKIQNLKLRNKEIIFYLENSSDWLYLKFLYHSLNYLKKKIIIVSSDNDYKFDDCQIDFYIGRGFARTFFFRLVNTKYFVLTMTDLNNFYLKKSLNVDKYVYVFHSLVSTHRVYRDKAYNSYDVVLCPTEYHFNELLKTEQKYNLNEKKLIKYGYPRIQEIIKKNNIIKDKNKKEIKILIAPTWGLSSLLNFDIIKLINILIKNHYQVHLRLHPMSYRKSPKIVGKIKNIFKNKNNSKFFFHENIYNDNLINECDFLITEWSGIAFEFAFSRLRPVFFIDTPPKINNPKWREIDPVCFEQISRDKIGFIIKPDCFDDIINKINLFNSNKILWETKIADFREKIIYDFDGINNSKTIENIFK